MSDEYKMKTLTIADQSVVQELFQNYFCTGEPLNEAIKREKKILWSEQFPLDFLCEGLSLASIASTGEVVGIILNSKADEHFNRSASNDQSHNCYRTKILKLLDDVDKQITFSRKLNDNDKEMAVWMLTVNDKWRNKGIGKKLLQHSVKLAKSTDFKYMRSICTSAYSLKIFLDCGFKVVYSLKYEDCISDGKIDCLPQKPHTHIKGMLLDLQ